MADDLPTYGKNLMPVPAMISCTGSISVPPIRKSGPISAAALADASVDLLGLRDDLQVRRVPMTVNVVHERLELSPGQPHVLAADVANPAFAIDA